MSEAFLTLTPDDRIEALAVAADKSGRPIYVLEKDIWVVWTLSALFDSPFGEHLVFKGGTSLSKAYQAINRFSEDIDVTYDIRQIAPDLLNDQGDNPLPTTNSQRKNWSKKVNKRLPQWIQESAFPHIQAKLQAGKLEASARADAHCIYIDYATQASGYGYVAPSIKIDFGARSTGEPAETREISCDAATYLKQLQFPVATPRVMRVERTFWEKATAIHVFCQQGEIKDRLARHWYDVAQLGTKNYVEQALSRRDTAMHVAEHKSWFFAERDSSGNVIDYAVAVNGGLILVPTGTVLDALAADFAKMINDNLFVGTVPAFEWVLKECLSIQERANKSAVVKANPKPAS